MNFNILIQDSDQYFAQGLASLLQDEFMSRKTNVTFLTCEQAHLADLLILSSENNLFMWATHTKNTVLVMHKPLQKRLIPRYLQNAGTIRRCDTKEIVLQVIDREWKKYNISSPDKEKPYKPLMLTPREHQILCILAQEAPPYQIAKQLKLNIKTISGHKRNAMRKLGFSRSNELYRWLLHGGLAKITVPGIYENTWLKPNKNLGIDNHQAPSGKIDTITKSGFIRYTTRPERVMLHDNQRWENDTMLKTQMEIRNARKLAQHYLPVVGISGTPEDRLTQLKAIDHQFLMRLRQVNNAE